MGELRVSLEEGFSGDDVTVRIAGKTAFKAPELRTRLQIGLADQFTVDVPDGDVDVTIEVPDRGIHHHRNVPVNGSTYVGISVGEMGDVEMRTSSEPFGYV